MLRSKGRIGHENLPDDLAVNEERTKARAAPTTTSRMSRETLLWAPPQAAGAFPLFGPVHYRHALHGKIQLASFHHFQEGKLTQHLSTYQLPHLACYWLNPIYYRENIDYILILTETFAFHFCLS